MKTFTKALQSIGEINSVPVQRRITEKLKCSVSRTFNDVQHKKVSQYKKNMLTVRFIALATNGLF